ncbi:hypothetical protein C4D60_Mb06t37120 [Musa balbisiana]|uniref:non-specific serine/threonine protein kinase n=1 Tax=Musa balbisiana TaxID=52838 RepID=A0A4S8ITF9_MUSBA|nr:hypothetical protein C4D60_Mb06t37120 [Musa balbisiana]
MKSMELHSRVALASISWLLLIQFTSCGYITKFGSLLLVTEDTRDQPDTVKWTCVCAAGPMAASNYTPASNCSESCGCTPVTGGSDRSTWNCSCAILGPQVPGNIHDTTCFTTCNCTSDPTGTSVAAKKHLSNRGVLVILLLCVVLATIALLAVAAYCFYYKDRLSMRQVQISSEKDSSWNSTINLISHRSASFPQHRNKISLFFKPISGIIELISRLNHCHVVPLLGYCIETQGRQLERLLVFEYMPNGNLRDCLDARGGKEPMDWETRVRIALGAAKGLEYLHEAAAPRILHRDIKSTNILLDDNYRAKITDLGMAKHLMTDDLTSCSSSPARMLGTFGYFAPEYAIVGRASRKSDVFSFGVVILELITGRKPIFKSSNKEEDSLVIWATSRLQNSKLVVSELPDLLLKGKFPEEEMQIMGHLARECLQWDPDLRPTMSEIVQILLTIAPDKSRRRYIPTGNTLLWSSYSHSIRGTSGSQTPEVAVERKDPNRAVSGRCHNPCSLPMPVERDSCGDHQAKPEPAVSAEHMERLILLTSNGRSWRSSDDETVDLTEPRLESFMQAYMSSL